MILFLILRRFETGLCSYGNKKAQGRFSMALCRSQIYNVILTIKINFEERVTSLQVIHVLIWTLC